VPIEIGKAEVLRNFANNGGRKIALFVLGNMQPVARKAVEQLTAQGHDVALINPRFFKPIDAGVHEFFGRTADVVATLEDHVLMGGYGSTVLELYADRRITTPVFRLGWPDEFIEHATTVDYLRTKHGLTAENLVAQVTKLLGQAGAKPQISSISAVG
jgi:1-deoxy-D-xylulose-5-phosphate synthase